MYEIKINDQEVIKSFWPVEWLYSRILKAVIEACITNSKASKPVRNKKLYNKFIFYCLKVPKISRIWGGQKLIIVNRTSYEIEVSKPITKWI